MPKVHVELFVVCGVVCGGNWLSRGIGCCYSFLGFIEASRKNANIECLISLPGAWGPTGGMGKNNNRKQ